MNKLNKNTKILLFCALAVVVNVVFGDFVSMLKIPLLFMDTIGTIFIAACYGMGYGVLTGVATNLLMGFTASPSAIPFALVNVVVAVVVALISKVGKRLQPSQGNPCRTAFSHFMPNGWSSHSYLPLRRTDRIRNRLGDYGLKAIRSRALYFSLSRGC